MSPRYCSLVELAHELGVGKDAVYAAARRGEIPGAFQIGRRWRVNKDAFDVAQMDAARQVALRTSNLGQAV